MDISSDVFYNAVLAEQFHAIHIGPSWQYVSSGRLLTLDMTLKKLSNFIAKLKCLGFW